MERRPLARPLVIMVVGFLLLIPIAGIIRGTGTNVVKSGGLPGAAVAADPLVTATTGASTVAGAAPTAAGESAATFVPVASASTSAGSPAGSETSHGDLSAQSSAAPTTVRKTATTPASSAAPKKTTTTPATTTAAKKAPATTAAPKATSPAATKAPATTAATSPPKTQATTTTTTTTDPAATPPPNTYSKADAEAIIRSVWPAELADEAVRIAKRESNLVPTVRNWCCFGLFQIYFQMNRSTLAAIGVTAAEQLYDPRLNAAAAYAIYQRSGWGPWGQ